jgi:hypothetical protein
MGVIAEELSDLRARAVGHVSDAVFGNWLAFPVSLVWIVHTVHGLRHNNGWRDLAIRWLDDRLTAC